MRWLIAVLTLTSPVLAAELCVQDGTWICCHHLCDLFTEVEPAGYSTDGPPNCAYGSPFSISSSDQDRNQNEGPLPPDSVLYLWVDADATYGFAQAVAHLSGELEVLSFDPLTAGVYWDPVEHEFTVVTCLYEPTVLASIWVRSPTSVEPDSWGRIKALYNDGDGDGRSGHGFRPPGVAGER